MGQSKIPLYAYVDESGNTGGNVFDENQPDFLTAALISKGDFDMRWSPKVREIASTVGESTLHASELGLRRAEEIAGAIRDVMQSTQATFFVSRVEKKYLIATKIFDSILDSGENAAVAWHHYNIRPLRLLLCFKLAFIVDVETAKIFWKALTTQREDEARRLLPSVCERLIENVDRLPDQRSREILTEGLGWAHDNPESIQIGIDRKLARQGHFPNLVAFFNLLAGLDEHSRRVQKAIAVIVHDEQSEFEKSLTTWHELLSKASPGEIEWVGEKYRVQKVSESKLVVAEDSASVGIQVVDFVLWLYRQNLRERELPPNCMSLLNYVYQNGWHSDFSFRGVEASLLETHGEKFFAPVTEEEIRKGREMGQKLEAARQSSMKQYSEDQVPPFMRNASKKTTSKL